MESEEIQRLAKDERVLRLMEAVAWSVVENCVMAGEVDINELSDEEVIMESFRIHMAESSGGVNGDVESDDEALGPVDFLWSSNHQPDLSEQAEKFLEERKFEFATLFYATWIEHWLNRIIMLRAVGSGMNEELATALIRSSRTEIKMGRIWTALGAPRFPKDIARRVTRVMEVRNGFVHYKWPSEDEVNHGVAINRSERDAQDAKSTVEALIQLEDDFFYGGRTRSIKDSFRDGWRERASKE
jgi:hypothetical protein